MVILFYFYFFCLSKEAGRSAVALSSSAKTGNYKKGRGGEGGVGRRRGGEGMVGVGGRRGRESGGWEGGGGGKGRRDGV